MTFLAIFVCMLISFVFSGVETGLLSVNRARLRYYAKSGNAIATTLHSHLKQIDRLLLTVATFSTIFRIFALALLYSFLAPRIGLLGAAAVITLGIPILSLTLVVLPKPLFQRLPLSTLLVFARILAFCQRLTKPFFPFLSWLIHPFISRSKQDQSAAQNLAATVEIGRAAAYLSKTSKLSSTAAQLIRNVLRFRDYKITSSAIPLQNLVHVQPDTSVVELLELAHQTDIERLPILKDRKQITGVIDIFDLLLDGVRSGRCQSAARKIVSVTSTEAICVAIRKMRAARATLCTVTDGTSGRILGVVTLESLLRRLFIEKR